MHRIWDDWTRRRAILFRSTAWRPSASDLTVVESSSQIQCVPFSPTLFGGRSRQNAPGIATNGAMFATNGGTGLLSNSKGFFSFTISVVHEADSTSVCSRPQGFQSQVTSPVESGGNLNVVLQQLSSSIQIPRRSWTLIWRGLDPQIPMVLRDPRAVWSAWEDVFPFS